MYTLIISIVLLILGYVFYGRFCERLFRPDPNKPTPAYKFNDGVDYVPMPTWKVFMIQFLNIAGTGPIFGAIMGALFGPSCYLWIVFGCIFGGAMHDYFSGMLYIYKDGHDLPDTMGAFFGKPAKVVLTIFTLLMLLLLGAVFIFTPAQIIGEMIGGSHTTVMILVLAIMGYYALATMLPVDKVIGKIYPLFAIALIFMAISLLVCLFIKFPTNIPEVWSGLENRHPSSGDIFPCMFVTIACGAISGFHGTQSPIMARCIKNEKLGRPIFYGAMILEGVIALIWATVASYIFYGGGAEEIGAITADGKMITSAPVIVNKVAAAWLGTFGSILAILGVVAAPITSGDTALRSVRLIIAQSLNIPQKSIWKRLVICIPIFAVIAVLLWFNASNENGFNTIWQYFGWSNQLIATFTLWAITLFLSRRRDKPAYLVSLLPASFMTAVCVSFIATAKIGFNVPMEHAKVIGTLTFIGSFFFFYFERKIVRQRDIIRQNTNNTK